ncbi:hypothetical protein HN371_21145 [Candidatus Poribacteria bacterium]|jgi:hypothetical protein|nr:hypothetical protein [Candidatus Poribacteria bacterium]MBT5532136.1 hypothetical protein [Candidatus Poribacteria bacterium]MBT5714822.1 hypothetical protein [Candidatus Poribacteria bacterium]MBT7095735.1 hypothetical protein [Candidatus Poribacteria bacterium]MBT7807767.1 hypothetical protein [Candidatus Poribacteria bacterium]
MVDDGREEHRMLIFSNDSEAVQEYLIRDQLHGVPLHGLLERKMHEQSYTVTLYAMLKDYGLTPVVRIKPRIRFQRSSYDNQSSSAPLRYGPDDIVHFAELKRGSEPTETVPKSALEEVFGDAATIDDLSDDPAYLLVAQRDVFLHQPPFKTKTKVFGHGSDMRGIPIGNFLEALNYPARAEKLFKPFPRGDEFAMDVQEALEPYGGAEFQFSIYSRYERRDCILARPDGGESAPYRTTFDPWTGLGHVRFDGREFQLQILSHERATRWEHKIVLEEMDRATADIVSQEIRALRRQYLIGRVLSKSQTALSLRADDVESSLGLVRELPVGYGLEIEAPVKGNLFGSIDARRRLRRVFTSSGPYDLHPLNTDMVERHVDVACGESNGIQYTLDTAVLTQGPAPEEVASNGYRIIRRPRDEGALMRSAQDLRDRIPRSGFERCWNEFRDEGGYTVVDGATGRAYAVYYGGRQLGSVLDRKVSTGDRANYLVVKYLGMSPERYDRAPVLARQTTSGNVRDRIRSVAAAMRLQRRERDILGEMMALIAHLKRQDVL